MLSKFLEGMLRRDGKQVQDLVQEAGATFHEIGKSLFSVNGSIRPYLHYHQDYPLEKWDWREAHMLHVREADTEPEWASGNLSWWLAKFDI
jgi:hypothetical protein